MKAFPRQRFNGADAQQDGMDLRDYFATKVMAAIIIRGDSGSLDYLAKIAYHAADAMLEARVKK